VEARQPVAAYVESFHSRNGFSRDRMRPADAAAFDRELSALVAPFAVDGLLDARISGHVIWGIPHGPED
jgi:hypothetical protein